MMEDNNETEQKQPDETSGIQLSEFFTIVDADTGETILQQRED